MTRSPHRNELLLGTGFRIPDRLGDTSRGIGESIWVSKSRGGVEKVITEGVTKRRMSSRDSTATTARTEYDVNVLSWLRRSTELLLNPILPHDVEHYYFATVSGGISTKDAARVKRFARMILSLGERRHFFDPLRRPGEHADFFIKTPTKDEYYIDYLYLDSFFAEAEAARDRLAIESPTKDAGCAAYSHWNFLTGEPEEEEDLEVSEDDMLQAIHEHLVGLNRDLSQLHKRVGERLDRIAALGEKAQAHGGHL